MKVKLKHPRGIDGILYAPGIHEMPDAHESHWFFKGLVANGDLEVLEAPKSSDAPVGSKEADPGVPELKPEEKPKKGKR